MPDEEYEVESILQAKVKGGARGRKTWSYWVKWKNYGISDNTWEPPQSFGGAEHFIEHFWGRVDTNGRDFNNIREFDVGEEFFPSGPPRRKKAKKRTEGEVAHSAPQAITAGDSEGEVCSIIEDDEASPPAKKGKRRRSSGVVEDTEAIAPKRKRRGPPGIRPSEMEEVEKTLQSHRAASNSRGETSRGHPNESSSSPSTSRRTSPRKRQKSSPVPRRSPSADELLLTTVKQPRKRQGKKKDVGPPAETTMSVDPDVSDDEPVPTFGTPNLLLAEVVPETPPRSPPRALGPEPTMPAHRARAANPRVKLADDPNFTEQSGAIPTKEKLGKRSVVDDGESTPRTKSSGSKPGPGRSSSGLIVGGSRLVAQKNGKLTTVKPKKARTVQAEVHDEDVVAGVSDPQPGPSDRSAMSGPPPSAQELLEAAGVDPSAADLADFEDVDGVNDLEHVVQSQSVADAVPADPAPVVQLEAQAPTFTSRVTSTWNLSTIFGPLGLGRPRDESEHSDSEIKRYALYLNLDSAVSLPIALKDVKAEKTFLSKLDKTARNPTGQFYQDQHSIAMVNSLKAKGSYARIVPGESMDEAQRKHFERFISRMEAGELFVEVNGDQVLVMCASHNSVLCQMLGFPNQLLGLGGTAVVAHVTIKDESQYMEAVLHADPQRW